jgi:hypothetical protein
VSPGEDACDGGKDIGSDCKEDPERLDVVGEFNVDLVMTTDLRPPRTSNSSTAPEGEVWGWLTAGSEGCFALETFPE